MKCFKDGYIIAQLCQISGTGKTGRTRTDYCYLMSVFLLCRSRFNTVLSCPVSYKTLQFSDGNGFAFDTADTFSFTLALLRTYTAADCWKCTGLRNDLICFFEVSFFYFMYKCRDIDGYRTSLHTFCIFTVDAAGSFFHCFVCIISKANLIKVGCSYFWCLFSYRNFL